MRSQPILMLLVAFLSVAAEAAEPVDVPMKPESWSFTKGTRAHFGTDPYVTTMVLGANRDTRGTDFAEHNDIAYLKDVVIENGIVEMDVRVGVSILPGLVFRMQSDDDYELVYLRIGDAATNKFVQYAPVYNSELSWQLYLNEQANGFVNERGWTHFKAVFIGPKLEVYVDRRETPALVVERLRRDVAPGRIGIWGLLPTSVANFRYTVLPAGTAASGPAVAKQRPPDKGPDWSQVLPGQRWIATRDKDSPPRNLPVESAPRLVTSWRMSASYLEDDADVTRYPGKAALKRMEWSTANTDFDGVLPVDKFRRKKQAGAWQDNSHDMVWLRTTVDARSRITKRFEFDFSNKIVIYLNGAPLFAGNNTWNAKKGMVWGSLGWGVRSVYLPLEKGENELLIALISESDGWGLMGRFDSDAGISLH